MLEADHYSLEKRLQEIMVGLRDGKNMEYRLEHLWAFRAHQLMCSFYAGVELTLSPGIQLAHVFIISLVYFISVSWNWIELDICLPLLWPRCTVRQQSSQKQVAKQWIHKTPRHRFWILIKKNKTLGDTDATGIVVGFERCHCKIRIQQITLQISFVWGAFSSTCTHNCSLSDDKTVRSPGVTNCFAFNLLSEPKIRLEEGSCWIRLKAHILQHPASNSGQPDSSGKPTNRQNPSPTVNLPQQPALNGILYLKLEVPYSHPG